MKRILILTTMLVPFFLSAQQLSLTTKTRCESLMSSPKNIFWRSFQTVANQNKEISKTDGSRESEIKSWVKSTMKDMNDEATTGMGVFFESGTTEDVIRAGGAYGTGISPIYSVSNVKNGKLNMTMILPVSSHAGLDNSRKWAFTDKYDIILRTGGRNGQTSYLAKDLTSIDFVTIQEIEVPLIKDQVVEVLYNRHGSFGPDAYAEGRIIGIKWDGN